MGLDHETESSVRNHRWVRHSFETSAVRVQVIDGRLWVTHFPWVKYPAGVVPAGLTPWDKTNWRAATPATFQAGMTCRGVGVSGVEPTCTISLRPARVAATVDDRGLLVGRWKAPAKRATCLAPFLCIGHVAGGHCLAR